MGLRRCKFLVLDEADRLLTDTFKPELDYLYSVLPSKKTLQTLLFTATLTGEVEEFAKAKRPEGKLPPMVCKIEMDTKTPETLEQRYVFVPSHIREPYLYHIMRHPPIKPSSERVRKLKANEKPRGNAKRKMNGKKASDLVHTTILIVKKTTTKKQRSSHSLLRSSSLLDAKLQPPCRGC